VKLRKPSIFMVFRVPTCINAKKRLWGTKYKIWLWEFKQIPLTKGYKTHDYANMLLARSLKVWCFEIIFIFQISNPFNMCHKNVLENPNCMMLNLQSREY